MLTLQPCYNTIYVSIKTLALTRNSSLRIVHEVHPGRLGLIPAPHDPRSIARSNEIGKPFEAPGEPKAKQKKEKKNYDSKPSVGLYCRQRLLSKLCSNFPLLFHLQSPKFWRTCWSRKTKTVQPEACTLKGIITSPWEREKLPLWWILTRPK